MNCFRWAFLHDIKSCEPIAFFTELLPVDLPEQHQVTPTHCYFRQIAPECVTFSMRCFRQTFPNNIKSCESNGISMNCVRVTFPNNVTSCETIAITKQIDVFRCLDRPVSKRRMFKHCISRTQVVAFGCLGRPPHECIKFNVQHLSTKTQVKNPLASCRIPEKQAIGPPYCYHKS